MKTMSSPVYSLVASSEFSYCLFLARRQSSKDALSVKYCHLLKSKEAAVETKVYGENL